MPERLGLSMKSFLQSREAGKTYPDFLPPTALYELASRLTVPVFNPQATGGRDTGGDECLADGTPHPVVLRGSILT
jgi:hypothetical protein